MRTCNIHQFLMLILCLIVIYGILGFYYIAQSDLNDNKIKMEQTERIIYDRKRNEGYYISNTELDYANIPWYIKGGLLRPTKFQNESNSKVSTRQVWPSKHAKDDRVVEQLMFVPPNYQYENAPMKSILLYFGLFAWHVEDGQHEFLRKECPVNRCSITDDRRKSKDVDAILFRHDFVHPGHTKTEKQVWILSLLESPYASMHFVPKDVFNWTATYRHDSDIVTPYEKWIYYNPAVTQVEKLNWNYASRKTKQVAWFVSNCNTRNRRLEYAHMLSKSIKVDIYGACGQLECPKIDKECFKMLKNDYKFYLAFENINCAGYITEKFFVNGLQYGALPIVMGGRREEYERVAPNHSFVHVDDFESPEQLAEYLHRLDEDDDLYNEYFRWIGTGEFIDTRFFCRLCAMLHDEDAPVKHYEDFNRWWNAPGVCY